MKTFSKNREAWDATGFLLMASVVVGLRLYLAFQAPESHDIRYYWTDIAERVAAGARLYEETPYHFPPLWAWLLLLFRRISHEGIPFAAVLRSFLTAIDVCTACLLYRLAGRERGAVSPRNAALLFLANPVSIWVSSVQGQFDNLSLFFLVAAVLVSREPEGAANSKETPEAGFFLFLSIAAKQVSIFHPLLWLRRRGGFVTVAIACLSTLALLLPYRSQWRGMRDHFLTYTAVPRSYGFSEFVLYDSRWGPFVGALDFVAGIAAAWALSKERLARASLLLFLVLLFFAPGMGTQYLVWLSVAFWAVREIRSLRTGKEAGEFVPGRGPSADSSSDASSDPSSDASSEALAKEEALAEADR